MNEMGFRLVFDFQGKVAVLKIDEESNTHVIATGSSIESAMFSAANSLGTCLMLELTPCDRAGIEVRLS